MALAAVVEYCARAEGTITTPGVVQAFADSEHEAAIAATLASAEDSGLTPEQAETHLREGVMRWREQDEQRKLEALTTLPLDQLTAEQREAISHRLGAGRLLPKGPAT